MAKAVIEFRRRKRRRLFLVIALIVLVGLFIAAIIRIGSYDAEWAGLSVANITPARAMEYNIPKNEHGVIVNWSEDPAYASGVRSGDLIKSINNRKVKNVREFVNLVKTVDVSKGVLLDILRVGQPMYVTLKDTIGMSEIVKRTFDQAMGEGISAGDSALKQAAFANRSPAETAEAGGNFSLQTAPPAGARFPSPKEQGAANKELIEGHWLGMELIPLTPELAKEYRVPPDTKGLLVDEISLESAESGILAGDMVVAVDGKATPDLVAFTEATRRVKNRTKAKVQVFRRGQSLEFIFRSERVLGFSQNEAAQPITPGALSPHRGRSKACTVCHIIMITGGQLPTDAGDILPNPPPIPSNATMRHEYRGPCNTCHVIQNNITGRQLPADAGNILPNPPPIPSNATMRHEYRGPCNNCHVILNK
jgi:hypothetical protein